MPREHKVRQGECISSIAGKYGHFPETIWNDPANAQLKSKREDEPNILYAGDVVVIPDKRLKEESGATDERHRFVKKGVPVQFRLRLMERSVEEQIGKHQSSPLSGPPPRDLVAADPDTDEANEEEKPRADVPYILKIDGDIFEGKTDSNGMIECSIAPKAKQGRLTLNPGTPEEEVIRLRLGSTNPLNKLSGARQRLLNLGYECAADSEQMTPDLRSALEDFQEACGLPVTGEVDTATKNKLLEIHGS